MSKRANRKASWWKRNQRLHYPLEAVVAVLLPLGGITVTALVVGADSVKSSKVHNSVFLVCVAGVLMVLLLKPPLMWQCLTSGVRDVAAGRALDGDRALAVILVALLGVIVMVLTLVLDRTAFNRVHGISAVVAVNLWVGLRALWIKYGSHKRMRDLGSGRALRREDSDSDR